MIVVVDIEVVRTVMSTEGLQDVRHIDMVEITLPQGGLLMVEGQEGKGPSHLHILLIVEGQEGNGPDHLRILLIVWTGLMVIEADEVDGTWWAAI